MKLDEIQIIGVLFSILQVTFAFFNKTIHYLFGIIGILIMLYVMFLSKLYAEFSINVYYLIMSVYGWVYWCYGIEQREVGLSKTTAIEWKITLAIVLLSFGLGYYLLANFTDTDVPFWDSFSSCFAWGGMWLLAKRKVENWLLLSVSNLINIPLMYYKELNGYAFLYVFLLVVGIMGYFKWLKIMQGERESEQLA
ncbi:nicotinamide riboside transporter PnuC [Capnocytophaga sp. ARDL2]|uniref:nicotinamide riboside transporter PnuC n=1 Tax=Capnocytophaga sp. ARDL2 TaxID=3238809 RepID=UPI003556F2EB